MRTVTSLVLSDWTEAVNETKTYFQYKLSLLKTTPTLDPHL